MGKQTPPVLTLLGVVIGVAAVIAVVTFVNGINGYVAEKIFNLGADVFVISKASAVITNVDQLLEGQKRKDLTVEDFQAVRDACGQCAQVGASTIKSDGHVKRGEQSVSDVWIRGFTPSMASILDLDLTAGRMLKRTTKATAPTSPSSAPTLSTIFSPAPTRSTRKSASKARFTRWLGSARSKARPWARAATTTSPFPSRPT